MNTTSVNFPSRRLKFILQRMELQWRRVNIYQWLAIHYFRWKNIYLGIWSTQLILPQYSKSTTHMYIIVVNSVYYCILSYSIIMTNCNVKRTLGLLSSSRDDWHIYNMKWIARYRKALTTLEKYVMGYENGNVYQTLFARCFYLYNYIIIIYICKHNCMLLMLAISIAT